jgi:ribA/ribD-fused uncharacterized protein
MAKQLTKTLDKTVTQSWTSITTTVMHDAVLAKFNQNENLKTFLLQTGTNTLAEASPYDRYWGTGLRIGDKDAFNITKWTGANKLGHILEEIRTRLSQS